MSVVFESPSPFYQVVNGSGADDDPPANTLAGAELALEEFLISPQPMLLKLSRLLR